MSKEICLFGPEKTSYANSFFSLSDSQLVLLERTTRKQLLCFLVECLHILVVFWHAHFFSRLSETTALIYRHSKSGGMNPLLFFTKCPGYSLPFVLTYATKIIFSSSIFKILFGFLLGTQIYINLQNIQERNSKFIL